MADLIKSIPGNNDTRRGKVPRARADPGPPLLPYTQQESPEMSLTNERAQVLIASESVGNTGVESITS